MIVIAVIGVLAFLIGLIVRAPQAQQAAASGAGQPEQSPRWYEFTLALILLAAIAAFAIWLISSGTHWVWGETIEDWRSDTRTIIFAAVMVALAVDRARRLAGICAGPVVAKRRAAATGRGGGRGSGGSRRGARASGPIAAAHSRLTRFGRRDCAVVLDRSCACRAIRVDRAADLSGEPRA